MHALLGADWVRGLASAPELAEQLEAFVSRFGRMQDTIADKLIPRWLMGLAETARQSDRNAKPSRETRGCRRRSAMVIGTQTAQPAST